MVEGPGEATTSNTVAGDNFGMVLQAGAVHGDLHVHAPQVRRRPRTSAHRLARRPPWLARVLGSAGVLLDDRHVLTCLPATPTGDVRVEFPFGGVTATAGVSETHPDFVVLRLLEPTSLTPAPLSSHGNLDGRGCPGTPIFDQDVEAVVGVLALDGRVLPVTVLVDALPWLASRLRWRLDLDIDLKTHWLPRARGADLQSDSGHCFFTGRHAARAAVCAWLDTDAPVLVVTGGPGCGKSALLAHLLVPADAPDSGPYPREGAFDAAVHVSGLTRTDVLARLAAAFDLDVTTSADLVVALRERAEVPVVLVDAIEEAANPDAARGIALLLRELADSRVARVLVAVRSAPAGSDRERLLTAFGRSAPRIDLESPEYLCRDDVVALVLRRLPALSEQDARLIAERAKHNFLIAQLTTRWLALRGTPIPDELPETVGQAMDAYLDACGPDTALVRRMLTALAFARGAGLSRNTTWLTIADALHRGHVHDDLDLETVFHSAANYLVERSEDELDQPTYRLYHHALDEHLQDQCAVRGVDRAIVTAFTSLGRWRDADPYVLRHLPAHAVDAGMLDDLIGDVDFLVHAEPSGLLASLPHTRSRAGHLIRAVYRASHHLHQHDDPGTRCRMIALDAARHGADDLRTRLNDLRLPRPAGHLDWKASFAVGQSITPATVATLKGHRTRVQRRAAVSQTIAFTLSHDQLIAWDLVEHRQIAVIDAGSGEDQVVNVVAITWQERPVALLRRLGGAVSLWDVLERRELACFHAPRGQYSYAGVTSTEIDGRTVVVTTDGSWSSMRVRLWDLATKELIGEFQTKPFTMPSLPVPVTRSGDRSVAALTARNGMSADIWDLAEIRCLGTIDFVTPVLEVAVGHVKERVVGVAYSKDNSEITVWDLLGLRQVGQLPVNDRELAVNATIAQRDGRAVAVASMTDRSVHMWDLATFEQVGVAPIARHDRSSISTAEVAGRLVALATSSLDETVEVLDLGSASTAPIGSRNRGPVVTLATTERDGRLTILHAQPERKVRCWSPSEDSTSDLLPGPDSCIIEKVAAGEHGIVAVSVFHRDDRDYRHSIEFWDLVRRQRVGPQPSEQALYADITLAGQMAVACDDLRLRVWNLGSDHYEIDFASERFRFAVAVGRLEGRPVGVIASSTKNGEHLIEVWDLTTRHHVFDISTAHTGNVKAIALAVLDGRLIAATASADESIRVTDLVARRQIGCLNGHVRMVTSVLMANVHNRLMVVSGSVDRTIRLWDPRTLACVEQVDVSEPVLCMTLSARGSLVFGQGSDVVAMECADLSALTPTQRPF